MTITDWELSPYVSPCLLVERERRCLRQSLVLPLPDLTWRVIVLDVLLQLIVLAVSQWHLVVDCLKAAKEMHSMKYCCFALVLRAVTLNEGGGKNNTFPSWTLLKFGWKWMRTCLCSNHLVLWPSQNFLLTSSLLAVSENPSRERNAEHYQCSGTSCFSPLSLLFSFVG